MSIVPYNSFLSRLNCFDDEIGMDRERTINSSHPLGFNQKSLISMDRSLISFRLRVPERDTRIKNGTLCSLLLRKMGYK
jgi:hypothetical protein